jgi:uncharacterized membrane protein YfcA
VLGVAVSVVIGFVSSLLGIGGGFIHVPVMVNLLNFPVHVASATSHFTLTVMTAVGSVVHLLTGTLVGAAPRVVPLSLGVVVGAQVGARVAQRSARRVDHPRPRPCAGLRGSPPDLQSPVAARRTG